MDLFQTNPSISEQLDLEASAEKQWPQFSRRIFAFY